MRPFVIASVAFILALSVNAKDVSKTDSEQNKPGNTQASPEHTSTQIDGVVRYRTAFNGAGETYFRLPRHSWME